MAVRDFNGSTDRLNTATGGASGMTFGTFAVLFRRTETANVGILTGLHASAGAINGLVLYDANSYGIAVDADDVRGVGSGAAHTNWQLVVIRKATGNVLARKSSYNFGTATWSHENAPSALNNWTSPGTSGTVRFDYETSSFPIQGRMAVRAVWSNALPWSADTTGDAAIVAAGLHTALANWVSANPTALHAFNQAAVTTDVEDLSTTGTADQVSRTGTTVVTDDDPPGFSFGGATLVEGSAAGSYAYTGTAAGTESAPSVEGSASGAYVYSGSAAGVIRDVTDWSDEASATTSAEGGVGGQAAGAYAYTGTAAGEAVTVVSGTASGDYDYTGSASGETTVSGAASGSYGYAGTAAGSGTAADVEGAAAGTYSYSGTAEGTVTVTGTASGSYTYAGTAAGTAAPSTAEGSAAGDYTYAGTAAGSGEAGPVDGQAAGTYTYAGTAAGEITVVGAATGAYAYTGAVDGTVTRLGTAAGTYTYTGAADGTVTVFGTAAAAYTYTGSALGTGVIPPVPYLAITVGPLREPVLVATMRDPLAAAEINPAQPVTVGELRDTAPVLGVLRDVAPAIGELRDLLMVDEMRDPISVDELRE
jgi:hypothetical protein